MLCSFVYGYQHFRSNCCRHLHNMEYWRCRQKVFLQYWLLSKQLLTPQRLAGLTTGPLLLIRSFKSWQHFWTHDRIMWLNSWTACTPTIIIYTSDSLCTHLEWTMLVHEKYKLQIQKSTNQNLEKLLRYQKFCPEGFWWWYDTLNITIQFLDLSIFYCHILSTAQCFRNRISDVFKQNCKEAPMLLGTSERAYLSPVTLSLFHGPCWCLFLLTHGQKWNLFVNTEQWSGTQ
jgi:hypothetical protein